MEERLFTSITIGTRGRRDLGDLQPLQQSIAEVGLLHPIVVTPDNRLIAGHRRLEAFRALGRTSIPVTVVELDQVLRGEYAENVIRKDFLPSEMVAIARELEPIEREAAKKRQGSRTDLMVNYHKVDNPTYSELCTQTAGNQHNGLCRKSVVLQDPGKTRDKVAKYVGASGRTLEKAKTVVEAAEQAPEKYGTLVKMMDDKGVHSAYRKLRRTQDEENTLAVAPPAGRYRTIVIDPPWEYDLDLLGRSRPEYKVSYNDIALFPAPSLAEDDCHLYLWVTNAMVPKAAELVRAWGFEHKTLLTWIKPSFGLGAYFRNSTEHVIFAVRGQLPTRVDDVPTHFEAPRRTHSEKPDLFYKIVQRASYPPYLDAYARKRRHGWTAWGNEAFPIYKQPSSSNPT